MASKVVDLETYVKRWAQEMYDLTTSWWTKLRYPKDRLDFRIEWKDVGALHKEPTFTEAEDVQPLEPKVRVLFETKFTNNTDTDQTHSFKTEQKTISTCDVTKEKGVTMGFDLGVQLKMPLDVLNANAGFKREVTLTKAEAQTVQEELTWSVDTNVTVPRGHETTAQLRVEENSFSRKFTIVSEVWGRVHVAVFDRKNNTFLKSIDGDLYNIMAYCGPTGRKLLKNNRINFETKGECSFRYAVKQHVETSNTTDNF